MEIPIFLLIIFVGLPVLLGIITAWIDVGFGARFSYVFMVETAFVFFVLHYVLFSLNQKVNEENPGMGAGPTIFIMMGILDVLMLLGISVYLWAAKKDRR